MNSQEEVYSISNAEHTDGSNRYTFRYSPHWRNVINKALSIGVRSIKLHQSPLYLWIDGLSIAQIISDQPVSYNISPEVDMTSSMVDLNAAFRSCREDRYTRYTTYAASSSISVYFYQDDYQIAYFPQQRILSFRIISTSPLYFVFDSNDTATDFISSDFMNLVGITNEVFWTDLNKLSRTDGVFENDFNAKYAGYPYTITMNTNGISKINFTNVWDHCEAIVKASFVDLSYDNYIGITNETFVPPKEYPIVFGDQKFHIDLFDQSGNEIELNSRDSLIIESMMNSYQ